MRFNWSAIPPALRERKAWGVYKADTKDVWFVPNSRTRFKANDLTTAMSFDDAQAYAERLGSDNFGPLLFVGPDHVILDFDKTENIPALMEALTCTKEEAELVARQQKEFMSTHPTWIERSVSGTGYHAVYAVGQRGSGTFKVRDMMLDVKGNPSFVYMTGDVVFTNDNVLALAGDLIAKLAEYQIEKKDYTSSIKWSDERQPDQEVLNRLGRECPASLSYLGSSQDQTSLGDQRFGALKDLIVRSMNYEQVERIYLQAPCCSFECKSTNRGSTDKNEEGYKNFLRREIDRAAHELIKDGQFNYLMDISSLTAPAPSAKLAYTDAPLEQSLSLPALFGLGAKAQAALDQLGACAEELSLISTLSFLSTACGRHYVTRTPQRNCMSQTLAYLPIDYFVVTSSGEGKSTAFERLKRFALHIPDSHQTLRFWANPGRFQQIIPKSISANSLHTKIDQHRDGVVIHLDEISMILSAASHMGGFEGWINTINNARTLGGILSAPDYTEAKKMLPSIEEPIVSIIATGIPSQTAIQLKKDDCSRITGGYMGRHLTVVLKEEEKSSVFDAGGFSLDIADSPDIRFSTDFLDWLEAVTAKRERPTTIAYGPEILPAIEALMPVNNFDADDNKTHAFNRYAEYAFKLSGLLAVLQNPYNPRHTVETVTWATEFVRAARGAAHSWFCRNTEAGAVRVAEREDVDPSAVVGRLFSMVSQIQSDKAKRTDAYTKIAASIKKCGVNSYAFFEEHNAIPLSYLQQQKNKIGLSRVPNAKEVLLKIIEEGEERGMMRKLMNGKVVFVQAIKQGE